MKKQDKQRGNWRWLFRRDASPAVLQQLENGTWQVTFDGVTVGIVNSERSAVELVTRLDKGSIAERGKSR